MRKQNKHFNVFKIKWLENEFFPFFFNKQDVLKDFME